MTKYKLSDHTRRQMEELDELDTQVRAKLDEWYPETCPSLGRDLITTQECLQFGRTDSARVVDVSGTPCGCGPACVRYGTEPADRPEPLPVYPCKHKGPRTMRVKTGGG